MIEAKDLSLIYPDGTLALKDINIQIGLGQLVYITGPSGSGKTSFLKLLMGMEYPTSGHLKVLDQTIDKENISEIRKLRRNMGPVFQDFKLLEGRKVMENVIIGMRFLNIPSYQMKDRAKEALEKVGLSHKANALVDNLSLGERQRVAIARAVVRRPALIIADEPTGNLDKENAINILELLTSFKDNNTTVIITTHATHLIENIDDGLMIHIDKGNIVRERMAYE